MMSFVASRHDSSTQEEYKKNPDDVMVNYIMWYICGWVKSRPAIQTGGVRAQRVSWIFWVKEGGGEVEMTVRCFILDHR